MALMKNITNNVTNSQNALGQSDPKVFLALFDISVDIAGRWPYYIPTDTDNRDQENGTRI